MSTPDADEQIRKWATNKLFLFGSAYHNVINARGENRQIHANEMNRRCREFVDMTVELVAGRLDAPPPDDDWVDFADSSVQPPTTGPS